MRRHLSANDYYSENEKIIGQWHGKAAQMLGLEGRDVTEDAFAALRSNRHPKTGEKLTPRRPKVAFHDFVISAPKSVSVAAMVGGDERVIEAFDQCALRAFERLESFAAVRVRAGKDYNTEKIHRTGNAVAAIFRHDTSRLLDPQLHTHLVFANVTWDEKSGRWLALQPKEMAEQSKEWIRGEFYRDLAQECRNLGYITEPDGEAFRLSSIDRPVDHAFSQRAIQRDRFIERYREFFEQEPDKKRVEQFIKDQKTAATRRFKIEYQERFGTAPSKEAVTEFVQDWRSSKMAHSTREKVHALQQSRITLEQTSNIKRAVSQSQEAREEIKQDSQSAEQDRDLKQPRLEDQQQLDQEQMPWNMWEDWQQSLRNRYKEQRKRDELLQEKLKRRQGMQRLKKAISVSAALNGHPTKLMARRVQQLARKKHHGTQRRAY